MWHGADITLHVRFPFARRGKAENCARSEPFRTRGGHSPPNYVLRAGSIAYCGVLQWIDPRPGGLMRRRNFIAGMVGSAAANERRGRQDRITGECDVLGRLRRAVDGCDLHGGGPWHAGRGAGAAVYRSTDLRIVA